ncbi:hypothetical protein pb186bvf_001778 [Paramecium bursaria]
MTQFSPRYSKTYTFAREQRFKPHQTYCQNAYYEIDRDASLSRQGHRIGKSKRSDFTKPKSEAPAPSKYQFPDEFSQIMSKSRGKSFGESRERTKEFGYLTVNLFRNPGVGSYTQYIDKPKLAYTMRPKTITSWLPNFLKRNWSNNQPGPADYDSANSGAELNSRYRNNPRLTFPRQMRFNSIQGTTPGPSQYKQLDGLNDSGFYFLSQHKGNGKRTFPKEIRKSFIDKITDSMRNLNSPRSASPQLKSQ